MNHAHDDCNHIQVTAATAQPAPVWLPIATAPRDGTRVLIYTPKASRQTVQEAYWATPWEAAPDDQCWWSTPHGPAGRGYTILQAAVTYWMPLPAPPHD